MQVTIDGTAFDVEACFLDTKGLRFGYALIASTNKVARSRKNPTIDDLTSKLLYAISAFSVQERSRSKQLQLQLIPNNTYLIPIKIKSDKDHDIIGIIVNTGTIELLIFDRTELSPQTVQVLEKLPLSQKTVHYSTFI